MNDINRNNIVVQKMALGHFHKLLCEEMIFPLHKGKNYGLSTKSSFTKVCGNTPFIKKCYELKDQ